MDCIVLLDKENRLIIAKVRANVIGKADYS